MSKICQNCIHKEKNYCEKKKISLKGQEVEKCHQFEDISNFDFLVANPLRRIRKAFKKGKTNKKTKSPWSKQMHSFFVETGERNRLFKH